MNIEGNDITIGTCLAVLGLSCLATAQVNGWPALSDIGLILLVCSGIVHAFRKARLASERATSGAYREEDTAYTCLYQVKGIPPTTEGDRQWDRKPQNSEKPDSSS
jgi:hypothetical protein